MSAASRSFKEIVRPSIIAEPMSSGDWSIGNNQEQEEWKVSFLANFLHFAATFGKMELSDET